MSTARTAWDFRQNAGQNGGGMVPQSIFLQKHAGKKYLFFTATEPISTAMTATSNIAVASLFASLTVPKST